MSKWEKGFYSNQFCEIKQKLDENLWKQQELYENLLKITASIEERLGQTEKVLNEFQVCVKGTEKSAEYKIYEVYMQLREMMDHEAEMNREGFQEISSLMKLLLVNSVLDDMEQCMEEKQIKHRSKGNGRN